MARTTANTVDDVADELYALPADEFVAARNDRAKQLRQDGAADTAREVAKLAKPNAVAWLANHLVRQRRREVDELLELGAALRTATSALDADQLRQLSRQQHQVIAALVEQARALAADAGQPASEATARGLTETLHAALADGAAADQLASGRLSSGLSGSGFPGVDLAGAPPARAPSKPRSRPDARAGTEERELDQARQAEAEAREAAETAETRRAQAHDDLERARAQAAEAAAVVERLQAELDTAASDRTAAERAVRQARKAADQADQASDRTRRRADEARRRLDELGKH